MDSDEVQDELVRSSTAGVGSRLDSGISSAQTAATTEQQPVPPSNASILDDNGLSMLFLTS